MTIQVIDELLYFIKEQKKLICLVLVDIDSQEKEASKKPWIITFDTHFGAVP